MKFPKFAAAFRRKTVGSAIVVHEGPPLKRVLGTFDLTMNGIAAIIGAGIFVLVGTVASAHAGPGIWLSFSLSGLACACVALAYAELAGMLPSAGSVYEYAYHTLGEVIAFLMGWSVLVAYAVGSSAVAVALSDYLEELLKPVGIVLPAWLSQAPPHNVGVAIMIGAGSLCAGLIWRWLRGASGGLLRFLWVPLVAFGAFKLALALPLVSSINLVAVAAIALISLHLYHGVKESVRFTTFLSVIETALVITFIILTAVSFDSVNLEPLMPFGPLGIISGAGTIFFAYIGFDSITTMGDECRQPEKSMPRAIIYSLAICTVLYILVGLTMVAAVPYLELSADAPLAFVLRKIGYGWLVSVFSLGVLLSVESTLNVMLYAQSRIIMSMSRDKLLPPKMGAVSHKHHTPYVAITVVGMFSALASGLFPIRSLAGLVNIGVMAAFVAVCVGVIVLRYIAPDAARTFRCPLMPYVPALGALISIVMMLSLGAAVWMLYGAVLFVGLLIYLAYGFKNSRLNQSN